MSTQDISCVTYNFNYQVAINQIAQDIANNGLPWSRDEGTSTNPLIAIDPSCGGISANEEERFLNKKRYMLDNNRNFVKNVTTETKATRYSRIARGYTRSGQIAQTYGTQSLTYTNPNILGWRRSGNTLRLKCPN
jgi:hypothetical protein